MSLQNYMDIPAPVQKTAEHGTVVIKDISVVQFCDMCIYTDVCKFFKC
jgi:hypothetical protein